MSVTFSLMALTAFLFLIPSVVDQATYRYVTALIALMISIGIISMTALHLMDNRTSTFDMGLLGYAVFGFLDIFKFQVLEHGKRPLATETELIVILLLTISLVVFVLAFHFINIKKPVESFKDINPQFVGRFFFFLLPLVIVLAAVFLYFKDLQTNSYFSLIGYFLKAFVLLSLFVFFKTHKRIYLLLSLAVFGLVMTDTSRRAYIAVVLPAIILYVDLIHERLRRMKLNRRMLVLIALMLLFVFLNWMRGEHDFGEGYVEGNRLANTVQYIKTLKSLDTFYNTGYIIEHFPEEFHYYYGETYVSVPVGLIPRAIWESKPVSLGAPLALMQSIGRQEFNQDAWMRINQYSLSPGFVGEAYANFGVAGVIFLSILFGWAAKFIDRRIFYDREHRIDLKQLSYLPIMISFLLLGRGDFYSAMIYSIFMFLFLRLMIWKLKAT
ncbi:MAG: O-antigen polysaccharide polymerase Wzy [Nitrospirae bacterium]|nr:O-antigen polysaccharide polymerase Wzy [Nitrospirota bacterium]